VLLVVLVLVAILGVVGWKITRVPPPQIAYNVGLPAADFTLLDQAGRPFHLADQRGHKVVLYFYRGSW
jgi:cytochrome oxidase Cu insertion factor (SCO1/SenC/PrrC family)